MDYPAFHEELLSIAKTVNTNDVNSLYRGLEQYLRLCARTGALIGNNACYTALGISRPTICAWLHETRRDHDPRYKEFAMLVKAVCAGAREQYGVEGVVNPILTIFHQKFYDGFRDNPPKENYISDPLGDLQDPERVLMKYTELSTPHRAKPRRTPEAATGPAT